MFAGANSSYGESAFVIFGVPFDKTSSYRAGTAQAPDSIRQASYCFEPYMVEHDISLSDIAIHDKGDLDGYDNVIDMGKDLKQNVSEIVSDDKIPIIIGGEHSISPFTVSGLEVKFDKIDVIVLDAHLDYRDQYEGNKNSHATAVRRISEIDIVENLNVLGVRSISKEESEEKTVKYISSTKLNTLKEFSRFDTDNPLYLSIDMDVFDPAYSPGVGNPEPFGVKPGVAKDLIQDIGRSIIAVDIVETNPRFDVGEITSNLAARLIYEFIGCKAPPLI